MALQKSHPQAFQRWICNSLFFKDLERSLGKSPSSDNHVIDL